MQYERWITTKLTGRDRRKPEEPVTLNFSVSWCCLTHPRVNALYYAKLSKSLATTELWLFVA